MNCPEYPYDGYYRDLIAFEERQLLLDELDDGTAEAYGYDPEELDPEDLETLMDFGTL